MYLVYYESFGCQMNAYDTEVISSLLGAEGYGSADEPGKADVIIVNTCSVREHAEERAIGRLNDLSRYSNATLVVCGCMAQRLGEGLFDRISALDVVAGTDSYNHLASMIRAAREQKRRIACLEMDGTSTYSLKDASSPGGVTRYLSITRGCENYCSYCIVPFLRGVVRSKEPSEIIREIEEMVSSGAKEVTLLGQNVMSYRWGDRGFTDLVQQVVDDTAVQRIRFLTTHPRDLDDEIFRIMKRSDRVCRHLHLPVQAGSDRILGLMNRGYTRKEYMDKLKRARDIVPDLAVTTDVIVGFCGETDGDFEQTLSLIEGCRFDAAFTFKYSPREGTSAARMADDVPDEIKRKRLALLNIRVQAGRRQVLEKQLGTETEILLDDIVKKGEYQFGKGRTPHFRNVLIPHKSLKVGDILRVRLLKLHNFTFIGEKI
jgi:tRNA-2-methylthio-N6-dimethylallyladenosine synthase